jgi:SAM-dependent methyltransferase
MIKVLQNWEEIGQAVKFLADRRLPRHQSTEKCWDFSLLFQVAEPLDRQVQILDMGCGGLNTLHFLYEMGFRSLAGMDLAPPFIDRLRQIRFMRRKNLWRKPYRILKGDIISTGLGAGRFGLLTCISVLEHGVNLDQFFQESARLLQPRGRLFVTVDYWSEKIDTRTGVGEFGLPWEIFSRVEVEKMIAIARSQGLELIEPAGIPGVDQACVYWQERQYTFIAMAFVKKDGEK